MTYRKEQLEIAEEKVAWWRSCYNTAKSTRARRDAAENLEFWTNKTAFLSNIYRGAFWDER